MNTATLPLKSTLVHRVLTRPSALIERIRTYLDESLPTGAKSMEVRRWRKANLPILNRGINQLQRAEEHGIATFFGSLSLRRWNTDARVLAWVKEAMGFTPEVEAEVRRLGYELEDFGLASVRLVTNNGVAFLVDAFQNITELETMRYHGIGTTNTAEAASDAALAAELTTVYNPDNTRATGSLAEGATANIYRTIGTNTVDGSATIVEHGILSQAATGGGVLLDRSVFAGVGLVSGNSLQSTYELTIAAGS